LNMYMWCERLKYSTVPIFVIYMILYAYFLWG
jgi:hypothetical protein